MNPQDFQKKLIAVARATPPDDRVPYAFKQRVMSRIRSAHVDIWSAWSSLLWRAAIPSVCVMILATAFARFNLTQGERELGELESVLLAPIAAETETW